MIYVLPHRWHVALDSPEAREVVGRYYAKKVSSCYLNPASEWKFYRSHSRSGICVIDGCKESNYAETNDEFAIRSGSILLSLDDFKRLVLEESSYQSSTIKPVIINVPKL